MRRSHNRTFYFINTETPDGDKVVKVGTEFAPIWTQEFKTLNDAVEAIKRRNKAATKFEDIENGIVAVYSKTNDGDTL